MKACFRTALPIAALLALLLPAAAWAEEEKKPALHEWAWGWRAGTEIQMGTIEEQFDEFFEGVVVTAFLERGINEYVRGGFEAGVGITALGETEDEVKFTRFYYGPYVRVVARPGKFSPYVLGMVGLYHAWASAPLDAFTSKVGFTGAFGGGLQFPIADGIRIGLEGRYRQFLREGTDPKVIEGLVMTHVWLY